MNKGMQGLQSAKNWIDDDGLDEFVRTTASNKNHRKRASACELSDDELSQYSSSSSSHSFACSSSKVIQTSRMKVQTMDNMVQLKEQTRVVEAKFFDGTRGGNKRDVAQDTSAKKDEIIGMNTDKVPKICTKFGNGCKGKDAAKSAVVKVKKEANGGSSVDKKKKSKKIRDKKKGRHKHSMKESGEYKNDGSAI